MYHVNMIAIFGLGNPGDKYKNHRHNIGFQILDDFADKESLDFSMHKILLSEIANYQDKILLVKPQTFMNHSGDSVHHVLKNYKIDLVCVVYDDVDIDLGEVKISFARGAGGHNGVQNIINRLGHKNFLRIRCGVRPIHEELKDRIAPPDGFEKFLLSEFAPFEEEKLKQGMNRVSEIIKDTQNLDVNELMNKYN